MKQNIEQIPVADLRPWDRNARTHTREQLRLVEQSIREFGFTNPVLVSEDNTILAGHGRVTAARNLGMDTVPCLRLSHLDDDQRRAYVIADNRLAERAGWDYDLLRLELGALDEHDFDLDMLGFDDADLSSIMDDLEIIADDDADPSNSRGHAVNASISIWIYDARFTDRRDETYQYITDNIDRLRNMDSEAVVDAVMEGLRGLLG